MDDLLAFISEHDKKNNKNETKVSYLAKKLPKEERDLLIEELGITQKTFYNWLKEPEKISISAFATIQTYIEINNKRSYHIYDLLKPLDL